MKKLLISTLATLTIIGHAVAEDAAEMEAKYAEAKKICDEVSIRKNSVGAPLAIWFDRAKACTPADPCSSSDTSIRYQFCNKDFSNVSISTPEMKALGQIICNKTDEDIKWLYYKDKNTITYKCDSPEEHYKGVIVKGIVETGNVSFAISARKICSALGGSPTGDGEAFECQNLPELSCEKLSKYVRVLNPIYKAEMQNDVCKIVGNE